MQSVTYSNSIGSQIVGTQLIAWSASQGIEMISLGLQAAHLLQTDVQSVFSPAHLVVSITLLRSSSITSSAEDSDESHLFKDGIASTSRGKKDDKLGGEFMRVDFVEVAAPLDIPPLSPLCVDHLSGSALSHISTREIKKALSSHSCVVASKGSREGTSSINEQCNKSALTYYLQDTIGQVRYTDIYNG